MWEQLHERLHDLDFEIELAMDNRDVKKLEEIVVTKNKIINFIDKHLNPKYGKPRDGQWFDEGRLTVIGKGITPEEVSAPKRGSVFSRDLPR